MRVAYIGTPLKVDDAYKHSSEHLFKFSGGNTGNFAFIHAIYNHIGCDFDLLPWHIHPDRVRGIYDAVVIACANQLGPHTDLGGIADLLDKMDLPIVAVGLGAQSGSYEKDVTLTDGTKRWLAVIAAHAASTSPNIGVRGEYSRRQLELHGFGDRAIVTGCPSNLINCNDELPETLKTRYASLKPNRIAVPAGMHLWGHLKPFERQLADIVERTKGLYVAQSELDMLRLARAELDRIEPDTVNALIDYIRPGLTPDEFAIWCKRYAICYTDASSWLEAMRTVDFVVGARFHGVMLAIQAGTPGGVIAHDSRTYEMCETMCIPVRHYRDLSDGLTADALTQLFEFDAANYTRQRLVLADRYVNMLHAAGIQPKADLLQLVRPR